MNVPPCHGASVPMRDKNIFWVEPIGAARKFQVRIWSSSIWGVWTHYHDATTPCYEDHNHCAEGHDPLTLRWKGYVMGWHFGENKPCFVQLTKALVWKWWGQLGEGADLRGSMVSFSRGSKSNSRLACSIERYQTTEGTQIPKDVDPRRSLYNLWRLPDPGWAWTKAPVMRLSDLGGEDMGCAS